MPVTDLKLAKLSDRFFYFSSVAFIISFYFSYFSFFSFLPFLFFLQKNSKDSALKLAFFTFFPFAAFLYLGVFKSLYIYYGLNLFLAFTIYIALVSYHFIYFYLPVLLHKKLKLNILFFPFLFAAFEYLKSVVLYGLPFGNLNLLVYDLPVFIKSASYFGSYFVTLELVFVNVAIYLIIKNRKTGYIVLLFVSVFLFLPYPKTDGSIQKTVSIVQGGIPQNEKWDKRYLSRNLNIYINASKDLKSDIVFWPESAYPYLFSEKSSSIVDFVRHRTFGLIAGVVRSVNKDYFNSAVFVTDKNIVYYNKQKLVPFAEFVPFRHIIGEVLPSSIDPGDFTKGRSNVVFSYRGLRVGAMICYEEAFDDISRRYKNMGANLLSVLTNDAWFDKTPTFYLLHRSAVFRAVENSIWLIRAANTGITEFISPTGVIYASLKNDIEGVLTRKITIYKTEPTFFDRFGYLFPYLLLIFVSLLIFYRIYSLRR